MARNLGQNEEQPRKVGGDIADAPETETGARAADIPADAQPAQKPRKKLKAGAVVAIVAVIAAAAIGVFFFLNGGLSLPGQQGGGEAILDDGTVYAGVTVLDADLSGKTMDEARQIVEQRAAEVLAGVSMPYTVDGTEYTLSSADLGAAIDTEKALSDAMYYGRQGSFSDRKAAIEQAKNGGAAIDVPVTYNEASIKSAVSANDSNLNVEPVDAAVEMNKISDEAKKITDMKITYTDEVMGRKVDDDRLAADIYAAVTSGSTEPVTAQVVDVAPAITRADIDSLYTERGVYKTEFSDSAEGRRYNVWKMGDIINGVKIEPGETWSINKEAGPRTYAGGWKGAPGISNGVYQEEAGGGICQTNSTLYNAVIRAEVEVVDKTPHSWPLGYVPGGLDATISTGSPDFKIRNNFDVPIYIIVRCDGEDARTIEIAILGPPYEDGLTRDFVSKETNTFGGGGVVEIPDPTLPAGARVSVIGAHPGRTFAVTKLWKDADGNVVKEEPFETVTYSPKPAQVRVGTGGGANESGWVQPPGW